MATAEFFATGCATLPSVAPATPATPAVASVDSTPSRTRHAHHQAPQCYGYVLIVENSHSQPVEIYEVGSMSPRFVTVALIGITEVPMTDRSQQFVAISRGVLLAASGASEVRPNDRVALERSCRQFQ
jgi:hypothetical protein